MAIAIYFSQSRARHYRLSMSAGSAEGLRHQIAERLSIEAVGHGLTLNLVSTTGSREVLDRLEAHQLDVAFVQGGLDPAFHPHVRQVAALYVEPLHLLVKPAPAAPVAASLASLRRKTVNLGPTGSGTHDLARDVLKFAGLSAAYDGGSGDYTLTTKSYGELLEESDAGKLPDAVFSVSALPSPVVRALVSRHRYQLVALPFGEAFALDALNRESPYPSPTRTERPSDVSKIRIYKAIVPPFTYGVDPPVPARDRHVRAQAASGRAQVGFLSRDRAAARDGVHVAVRSTLRAATGNRSA